MRPVTEIDIIAVARVANGVKFVACGTYVANVTMLTVGRQYHFGGKIAAFALTLVVSLPTGQTVGFFCIEMFEIVSKSLFDVFVNL